MKKMLVGLSVMLGMLCSTAYAEQLKVTQCSSYQILRSDTKGNYTIPVSTGQASLSISYNRTMMVIGNDTLYANGNNIAFNTFMPLSMDMSKLWWMKDVHHIGHFEKIGSEDVVKMYTCN